MRLRAYLNEMIKVSPEILIEHLKKHYEGSHEENLHSLTELVQVLGDLVEGVALAKVKTGKFDYHLQTLVNKIILTSYSIIHLCRGYEIKSHKNPELKVNVIDYPTSFVTCRALIENYLTLCYIYNNDLAEDERLFRYKLWEVSGLISRQSFDTSQFQENQQKKQDEAKVIETILKEIENMPEYSTLGKQQKKKLDTYGLPRIESWHNLIDESDLKPEMFKQIYSYYSSYAHSEYISILQISQANLNAQSKSNIEMIKTTLSVVRIVTCLSIKFYSKRFKSAEIVFNTLPNTIQMAVRIWSGIGNKYSEYK